MEHRALSIDQVFAYRLLDARKSRGWTQQQLADRMNAVGYPISRLAITKIEAGAHGAGGEVLAEPKRTKPRPVSLSEAIAFAAALNVAPPSLFLPIFPGDQVALTPKLSVGVGTAHTWAAGKKSLYPKDPVATRFYGLQNWWRRARPATREGLEALGVLVQTIPVETRARQER